MSQTLAAGDKLALLRLARQAVASAVRGQPLQRPDLSQLPPALARLGACFVTLTQHGELRGCIGGLEAIQPLAYDVQDHAAQTALHDPRFQSVAPAELDEIEIELSVLSEARPLAYRDTVDLLARLRPGVDGVTLTHGQRRATFLPQVWDRVPDAADFLTLLCQKMDLPDDEWRRGTLQVQIYQADKFTELEFGRG